MNKPIVIFGNGVIAELAYYYFQNDSNQKVVAFTADSEYINSHTFFDLPVVPFERITELYPPLDFNMFVALSYNQLNTLRESKYKLTKGLGYTCVSYISSKATVLINKENIGDNCFILENNTIQPYVKIGNNVTLWSGNHIGHHSNIKDNCFISSHVVIAGGVTLKKNSFLGTNSSIRNGITIGESCIIGSNSWISKSMNDFSISITPPTPVKQITLDRGIKLLK